MSITLLRRVEKLEANHGDDDPLDALSDAELQIGLDVFRAALDRDFGAVHRHVALWGHRADLCLLAFLAAEAS